MERTHVTVRARSLSLEDAKTSPWGISGNSISISSHSSKFEFGRNFGENCKTREVSEACKKDIAGAAVCGFNGTVSMEKSLEIDRLREELRVADEQDKRSREDLKSKLQLLILDHHHACEEVEKVRMEISVLNNEKEHLVNQVRELEKGSILTDDFQNVQNQLLILTKEGDKLMAQVEEQQSHGVEVESCAKSCDGKLLKAKAEAEALTNQLSRLQAKLHNDEVVNNKEKAKLRMRLRGTHAKLEALRVRYKETVEELDLMNRKFDEAAGKLKTQLASYTLEVLNLKKQLAAL